MIKLGRNDVSIYPNGGISWENRGSVMFRGKCTIGKNSYVSVGENGHVVFGDSFIATNSFKIVSYCGIEFGDHVLCGWECMFLDTDFHKLVVDENMPDTHAYGKIKIASNCWFGFKCVILKNTEIPDYCVIASNSILNRLYDVPEKSLLAGQPAKLKRTGIYWDYHNDVIQ